MNRKTASPYLLHDVEQPHIKGESLDYFLVSHPKSLSQRDWLTVASFIGETVPITQQLINPDNPRHEELLSYLWAFNVRSSMHLLLSDKRLVATAATSICSSDWRRDPDPIAEHYGVKDYLLHSYVGVDPDFRGQGVFSKELYPILDQTAQHVANDRGEMMAVLNLPPGGDGKIWEDKGFEPVPAELQKEFKLTHLAKKIVGKSGDESPAPHGFDSTFYFS